MKARNVLSILVLVALIAGCSPSVDAQQSEADGASEPVAGSDADESELSGNLHVNSSGGTLHEVWEGAWWEPFSGETDVTVSESSPADLSVLKAQVDSGRVEWDLAEIETGGQWLQAIDEGLISELDLDKLRSYYEGYGGDWDDLIPESIGSHGVWLTAYSTILVYDERAFEGNPPTSLSDLWDTDAYPGNRCIHEQALYNLEFALHADGLAAGELYPLDVERALTKLDELRPSVAKYWRAGAEPVQLVVGGECVMSTVWNGRPFAAETLEGIDYLGITFDGALLHTSWWAIPTGAPNEEAAYAALAYYMLPEVGAATASEIAYGNGNVKAAELASETSRRYVATSSENLERQIIQDDQWWLTEGPGAEEAFAARLQN